LSETRWTGYGEVDLQEGEKFIYSGWENEDNRHQEGVGFILSKKAKQSMIDWKPVSSRIIVARFKSNVRNVTVIQCYALTEES
jgi:hypothetical protein